MAEQQEINSFVVLNIAIQYCHSNDLVVNENTTKKLILGRKRKNTGGLIPQLEEISCKEYLGVTLPDKPKNIKLFLASIPFWNLKGF